MVKGGHSARGLLAGSASGRRGSRIGAPRQRIGRKLAEELIRTCSDNPGPAPFFLVCFSGRPLQVIPPDGSGAHIVLFSDLKLAQSFASERAVIFPDESVGLSPVASIADVLRLARAKSEDPDYVTPPCGLVLDFSYTNRSRVLSVAPTEISRMNSAYLARMLAQWMAK